MAGLPMDSVGLKLVGRFKEKLNKLQSMPPRIVKAGPVFENTMSGDAVMAGCDGQHRPKLCRSKYN